MRRKLLLAILGLSMILPTTGCGTIMFSQRQGQPGNRVDPNVVIMDGVGLLFFVVPGLVAFAVDFASGAIYLPEGVEKGEGPFIRDDAGSEPADAEESTEPTESKDSSGE